MRQSNGARGFSLLELMIALAIMAIFMALAAPSMKSFLASSRKAADAQSLYDAIRFAKNQSYALNHDIYVCPMNDATGACGTGSDWASLGLKVVDGNSSAVAPYKVWAPTKGNSSGSLTGFSQIVASPDGSMQFKNGTSYSGGTQYMIYCDPTEPSGANGMSVVFNSAGLTNMAIANLAGAGAYQKCP